MIAFLNHSKLGGGLLHSNEVTVNSLGTESLKANGWQMA